MEQAPQKFDMKDAVPLDSDAPAKFDMTGAVPLENDFTSNEDNEGTYEMVGPGGKKVKIPYGMISTASQAGYKMSDADRARYVKDAAADPNLNIDKKLPEGVTITGRNSAGQPIYGAVGTAPGSALSRFASSEYGALGAAAKGLGKFLDPRASEEEKARGQTSTFDNSMRYPERLIQPNVDMAVQAGNELDAGRASKETGINKIAHYTSAAEHAIASAIPLVGPFAASVIDQAGSQLAKGDVAGAVGTGVGNAIVAEAPEVGTKFVKGGVSLIPKAGRSTVEAITHTGPRQLREMAETFAEGNKESATEAAEKDRVAGEKHLGNTLDVLEEVRQIEDTHSHDERTRKTNLDKENEEKRQKFNKSELERIKQEGDVREKEIDKREMNIDEYNKKVKAVREANAKRYRSEVRRQNLESEKLKADKTVSQKFRAAYIKAKSTYNATWNAWRDLVKGVNADMSNPVATIKAQEASMNTQQVNVFREILRETTPAREDMSDLQQMREDIVKSNKFGSNYDSLSPEKKEAVDKIIGNLSLDEVSSGSSATGLKDIPAERLHTWKSQLERAVRSTQDGAIRYAIGKVLDSLRQQELEVSRRVGPKAESQLIKARAITGPYFDAFVRKPVSDTKAMDATLRQQTPEAAKAAEERAALERIAAYDPSILQAAQKANSLSEALSVLNKELGGNRQGPKNPTIPYKDLPDKPRGTVATPGGVVVNSRTLPPQPTPAGEFTPKPFEATLPPTPPEYPDRPADTVPEQRMISPEEYQKMQKENIRASADALREHGIRRSINALFYTVPAAVFSIMEGHPGYAVAELASTPSILAGSHALARLLEKPEVIDWISKVTPEKVKAWEALPPEQKAVFTQDMNTILHAAKEKGLKISPALTAFIKTSEAIAVTSAASERKKIEDKEVVPANPKRGIKSVTLPTVNNNPKEVLKQAQNLHSSFEQQGLVPLSSNGASSSSALPPGWN